MSSAPTHSHGSWPGLFDECCAENKLSCLTRQCVAVNRFGEIATLREDTAAWSTAINQTQRGGDWPIQITDARD